MTQPKDPAPPTPAYLWLDTEFTGLDAERAALLQVALVATDTSLKRLTPPGRDLSLCIRLEPDTAISEWVEKNLADLLSRCRSPEAVTVAEADRRMAALVDELVGPPTREIKRRPVVAGNTVHMDMILARRFLPEFMRRIHYRLLDVSTLKVLWNDWFPGQEFDKDNLDMVRQNTPPDFVLPAAGKHDAYYDIHASLAELSYYRKTLMR
jgi:oligoribonuclease